MGQDIKLTASDNFQLGGYRADPSGAPKAAVVVIQEIFGVNHHIRAVCDRLAGEVMSRSHRRLTASSLPPQAIRPMR
jgi:dienelactone hydrolase